MEIRITGAPGNDSGTPRSRTQLARTSMPTMQPVLKYLMGEVSQTSPRFSLALLTSACAGSDALPRVHPRRA